MHKPTFQSLQAGRGIATTVVVLHHCEGLFALPKYWGVTKNYFHFGLSGVNYFFVLSGIVILHAHLRDIGRPDHLKRYLLRRFLRVYPFYWVVLLAVLPVYFLISAFGKGFERQPTAIADAFTLLPIFHVATILPVVWTLSHEIMFYFVFGLLILNRRFGTIIVCFWMLSSIACLWLPFGHPMLQVWWSPLHLLFGFGILVRLAWQRLEWNGTVLAVTGLLGLSACAILEDFTHSVSWSLPLAYGLFASAGALGFMLIEKRKNFNFPQFLLLLGDASYSIYLVHFLVLSISAKVLYRIWSRHPTSVALPFVLLVVIALGAGIAIYLAVERPIRRKLAHLS